jgi:hypothetical protein
MQMRDYVIMKNPINTVCHIITINIIRIENLAHSSILYHNIIYIVYVYRPQSGFANLQQQMSYIQHFKLL